MKEDQEQPEQPESGVSDQVRQVEPRPYTKPVLKNHGNLRLISQMS
jgi:hypothetical protein